MERALNGIEKALGILIALTVGGVGHSANKKGGP
jgi:hypothetical protein